MGMDWANFLNSLNARTAPRINLRKRCGDMRKIILRIQILLGKRSRHTFDFEKPRLVIRCSSFAYKEYTCKCCGATIRSIDLTKAGAIPRWLRFGCSNAKNRNLNSLTNCG